MKRPIFVPQVEGTASRQAHADLPAGTYEREISKEGFFGPAALLLSPASADGLDRTSRVRCGRTRSI